MDEELDMADVECPFCGNSFELEMVQETGILIVCPHCNYSSKTETFIEDNDLAWFLDFIEH
jgi:sarcosine oxidase delta subunit